MQFSLPKIDDFDAENFKTQEISERTYYGLKEDLGESFPYLLDGKWIYMLTATKKNSKTKFFIQSIATFCMIISALQDIVTQRRTYRLQVFNGEKIVEKQVDSSILTIIGVQQLLMMGCIIPERFYRHVVSFLCICATKAPIQPVFDHLGWMYGKSPIFLSSRAFQKGKQLLPYKYTGNLLLKPTGNFKTWKDMIDHEVIGNSALSFGLVLGFVGPILSYLNHFMDLGNFWFNFNGSSSKGKTTVAMLATSVFSKPAFNKGLFISFNGTQNAILSFIANASGHTVVIDEIGSGEFNSFRKFAYQICSGSDRKRLNPNGEQKESKTFNSVVLSTAEFPIVDDTAPDGIKARVYEVDTALTTSSQNSDAIKQVVLQNHGMAGPMFVEYLVQNRLENIVSDYYKVLSALKRIYENLHQSSSETKHALTDRILAKLAVIVLTAKYIEKVFPSFTICTEEFIAYVMNLSKSAEAEANQEEKAFDNVMQYVARHKNRFATSSDSSDFSIEGRIDDKTILVLKDVVEEILDVKKFENKKLIYKKWAESGKISVEKDRNYKRLSIRKGEKPLPCFVFNIK